MSQRILVSGSTGFIGQALTSFLGSQGHQVVPLTRSKSTSPSVHWNPSTGEVKKEDFEGFDTVIHLAGENIFSLRWTKKKKEVIFLSRCRDTWLLSQVLTRLNTPPKTMISASAVGYYGNRGEEILTETSSKGSGFLADVCEKWEESTAAIENRGTRVIHPRFGIVISPKGGFLAKMLPLFRLGLGGKLGDGNQFFSWIALEDLVHSLNHILLNESLTGAVNVTSVNPVRFKELVTAIAKSLHRPAFFNIPAWTLRALSGEAAEELFLSSTRAIPARLQATGYTFQFPTLQDYFN